MKKSNTAESCQKSKLFQRLKLLRVLVWLIFTVAVTGTAYGDVLKHSTEATSTPILVLIHSRECPVCARVRPIIKDLQSSYEPRVHFVMLDVTDDKSKAEAKATAKSIHLGSFFNLYSETFPCVGIFDSSNHTVRELCGYNSKEKYESYIKKALAKTGA